MIALDREMPSEFCKLYGPKESFESKCKSEIIDWLSKEAR